MRYNKAAVVYSRTGLKVIATHKKKMQTKTTLMLNSWFSEDEPYSLAEFSVIFHQSDIFGFKEMF